MARRVGSPALRKERPWWHEAVFYQVYLRSFADSNGDGVGDLPGLIGKLDYLEWLGVDAVWCSPINPSPNVDFGYDVSDYLDVEPSLGTMADLDRLIADAGRRGIRVLLDIVPNHTSSQHPWFNDPAKRDWYVWTDRPNNWLSSFGGPAWSYDETVGRWYLHNFAPDQPDLNWWNQQVHNEFERILRFWFDRGVAGFRIDVAAGIVKDQLLRDNPPVEPDDPPAFRRLGQRPIYNARRPEVHEVFRRWRRIAEEYDPPRVFLGETYVHDAAEWAAFYGADDELQLALNFMMPFVDFRPEALRDVVERSLAALPTGATPVWHGSSHDASRLATRWCGGDDRCVQLALTMLFTLPGVTVLYQGDEIGLEDVEVPADRIQDVAAYRDPERTPMPWTGDPDGGFTTGDPWLPLGDPRLRNVADQREDPGSLLHHTRRLVAVKKSLRGPYEGEPAPSCCWRYQRGATTVELDFEQNRATLVQPGGRAVEIPDFDSSGGAAE